MASHGALLIFLLLVVIVPMATLAREYIVGDETGWTIAFDYQAWAQGKDFRVGDKLVFQYPVGAHNVFRVNGTAFHNCIIPSIEQALATGNDTIVLATPGNKWYICGVGKHCEDGGQKLAIIVQSEASASSPPPSTAPSPLSSIPWVISEAPDLSPSMPPSPLSSMPYTRLVTVSETPAPSPSMAPSPLSDMPCTEINTISEAPALSPSMPPSPLSSMPYTRMVTVSETPAPSPSMAPSPLSDMPCTEINTISEAPALSPSMPPSPLSGMPYTEMSSITVESDGPAPSPLSGMPDTEMSTARKRPFIKFIEW